MGTRQKAFEVDKHGLARTLARRPVGFVLLELLQNALDEEGVTTVVVRLQRLAGGFHAITVEDNAPQGFADLRDAYVLFADSRKKGNPMQRGRFNIGEKLVIALCRRARIKTTKGTVHFEGDERWVGKAKREAGSEFYGELRMTIDEAREAERLVCSVLLPEHVRVSVSRHTGSASLVVPRKPLAVMEAKLQTEKADEEGRLARTKRITEVRAFEPAEGEEPTLYEMGIPVMPIDCAWHIDVAQKVPLNMDRDNVTPAYRRDLLAVVLDHMHAVLEPEEARAAWVTDALPRASEVAVRTVITHRYGERRVIADPSDVEGTKLAASKGYTVMQPGSLGREQWEAVRRAGAAKPAGQVTPSPKAWNDDPDAPQAEHIPESAWTDGMAAVAKHARWLAGHLLGLPGIGVAFVNVPNNFAACYGQGGRLTFNIRHLGRKWFDGIFDPHNLKIDELLVHEFGHEFSADHLSESYHDGLCQLAAKMRRLPR